MPKALMREERVFFILTFFLFLFQECVLERKLKGLLERDLREIFVRDSLGLAKKK